VTDAHPLPRVDDILADCAKGKIWSKLDMTNSFFQTKMDPKDEPLTAVTTPIGLYKWLVIPMGLRNAPSIHQRRIIAGLWPFIGKICHVYLDDVLVWSSTVEEHTRHLRIVLRALQLARLYFNLKKCHFYLLEMDLLGHHISAWGVEANSSKVERVLEWPIPKSAMDIHSFLGLVRYISMYLPKLAEHTRTLTPLMTKECKREFPQWLLEHQKAFDAIKVLVVSQECLTTIDHENMGGGGGIFVTCDASDWQMGAMLSISEMWESACPVAFDSMQFKGAELNYMKKNCLQSSGCCRSGAQIS
jgi:hypothetical protein